MKTTALDGGYYIKEMLSKDFYPLFKKHYPALFGDDHTMFSDKYYTDAEQDKIDKLKSRMGDLYELHLGLFSPQNEFIGFSFGVQETEEAFYIIASGVLPEFRNKGFYSSLLKEIIRIGTDVGFQKIYGTHCATNNAVIIPKLKLGFYITHLELSDMFGTIVHTSYLTNPLRRKVLNYRSGLKIPDSELKSMMKFNPKR